MPPRRRRSSLVTISSPKAETGSDSTTTPPLDSLPDASTAAAESQDSQVLPMLLTSFELEDFNEWWTSPPSPASLLPDTSPDDKHHSSSFEDPVEPLLVFPDEDTPPTQSTLKGICSDTPAAIPPQVLASPSAPAPRNSKQRGAMGVDKKGKAISPRESHILSERQRRKGMNHLFTTLGSLLPDSFSKSDKSTIVSEIILYIQSLQKDLEDLGSKRSEAVKLSSKGAGGTGGTGFTRADSSTSLNSNCTTVTGDQCRADGNSAGRLEVQCRPGGGGGSPNIVTSSCGGDVFITMCSPREVRSLFSSALVVIQRHKFQLVDANISSSSTQVFHYFHVKALNEHLAKGDTLQMELQKLTVLDPITVS